MKTLVVLALLISLCSGFQDWSYIFIANGTQAETLSPGTCTVNAAYTDATKTLTGTFTCTGLEGNITAAHIHYCDTYSITTNSCPSSLIADCPLVPNADGASGTFNCVFKDYSSLTFICGDHTYWNFHTTAYAAGEVRSNIVNMEPMCNVKGGVTLDSTVSVVGIAPTTGIMVPNFYIGILATTVTGTGGGYIFLSWDSVNQTLTVSGCFYGITSDITSLYFNYPGDATYFIYLYADFDIPSGYPFTLTYDPSDWDLAKIISGFTTVAINTVNNNGELTVACIANNYPTSTAPCNPYTVAAPTTAISCNVGLDGYTSVTTCAAGEVCGIDSVGEKYCAVPNLDCYTCTCSGGVSTVPSGYYVCCNTALCNVGSFGPLGCTTPSSGAGSISFGFLVALFVAVFMKWFN